MPKTQRSLRLWKVGYLVSERHHTSFKDAKHLSKPCLGLSKECLCISLHLSDLPSYIFGIFEQLHFVKKIIDSTSKTTPTFYLISLCSSPKLQPPPYQRRSSPETIATCYASAYCPHSRSPTLPPECHPIGDP